MNLGLWFDLRGVPGEGGPTSRRYGFTLELAEEAGHVRLLTTRLAPLLAA